MANFVLGFLHGAENMAQGIASPFEWLARTDIINPAKELLASGNPQAEQQAQQQSNVNLGLGPQGNNLAGGLRTLASNVGQVGLDVVAPEMAGKATTAVKGATDLLGDGFAGKVVGGAIRGAAGGAAVGGAFGVAQGVGSDEPLNAGNLAMNFLQGTEGGAELGGGIGAVAGGVTAHQPLNAAGGLNNATNQLFDGDQLKKLAQTQDQGAIIKQIKAQVGPVIADKVAPAIARTDDPHVVSNVIDNALHQHTTPPTTVGNEIAAPPPPEPVTPPPAEEAPQPFMNAPDTENPGPTHIGRLGAMHNAASVLNEGGTIDDAMHELFQGGMNHGEAKGAINELMNSEGGAGILDRSKVNAKINPEYENVALPEAQVGDTNRPVLNAKTVHNEVMRRANTALEAADQLNDHDLGLLDHLRNNKPEDVIAAAEDKDQFRTAVNLIKNYNDYTQASGAHLGQDIPYKQQYGIRPQYDRSTPEAQQAFEAAQAKLQTSPGYTKGAFFKDYDEAAQFGVQRANPNALHDLAQDANERASHLKQLALAKGLEEAHPGQVKIGQIGSSEEGNFRQLQIPGGSSISMPQAIADEINKRAPAPTATGGWDKYDTINTSLKNFKLAGGGFHSVNVLGSYVGQQLASGKAFTPTGVRDLADVIKGTFSSSAHQTVLEDMNQRGKLIDADASGLKYGAGETAADINPTGKLANIPVLKQIHAAIFDRQIPLLKLKIFDQKTEGLDRNNPEDLQKMTKIAKELNNNFGGINREIQGLTPKQFAIAARGFLATDYNEGQIHSLVDAFTKGGPDGKLAREVVFGKALLFGGLATVGGAVGGEFKGQTPEQVAFNILHKIVNPSFKMGGYKVGLPTTQVAEVEKPLEETVQGAKFGKPAQGIENFASARLAAIPSELEQLGANKNFYGQALYGKDAQGRPVPGSKTAANIASGVLPIPASQTVQTATGNESPVAAAANVVGLRATPEYNVQNLPAGQQTYITELQQQGASKDQLNAVTSFFSIIRQNASVRSKATNTAIRDMAKGDNTGANKVITDYNQRLVNSLMPWAQQNSQFMDQAMYAQLTADYNSPYTSTGLGLLKLPSANTIRKDVQRNPTKYGLEISGGQAVQ